MMPTDQSVVSEATSLYVGTASLRGDISRYAARFNLLEVSAEPGRHPKKSTLSAMRRAVPDDFVFSVVPPAAIASLESSAQSDELMVATQSIADVLGAKWWVLRTPPSVTPSARAARALEALVKKLQARDRKIAWEPRGVWREEEALRAAQSLGIVLVRDLLREDRLTDDPIVYTRIRALGEGAHVGGAAAERIAERLEGAAPAFVVIEGAGALRVRQVLREMFGLGAGEEDSSIADESESDDSEDEFSDGETLDDGDESGEDGENSSR